MTLALLKALFVDGPSPPNVQASVHVVSYGDGMVYSQSLVLPPDKHHLPVAPTEADWVDRYTYTFVLTDAEETSYLKTVDNSSKTIYYNSIDSIMFINLRAGSRDPFFV